MGTRGEHTHFFIYLFMAWAFVMIVVGEYLQTVTDNGYDREIHRLSAEVRQLKLDRDEMFKAVEQLDETIMDLSHAIQVIDGKAWVECDGRDEP